MIQSWNLHDVCTVTFFNGNVNIASASSLIETAVIRSVNGMSTQNPPKRLMFRWATLKGLTAIILFLLVAVLAEYLVVVYAMSLGVKDQTLLQWSFNFPGTNWAITIAISPLFHLVPIAVIITLVFSWTYLTRRIAVKPREVWKGKVGQVSERGRQPSASKPSSRIRLGLLKVKAIAYLWQRIHFARATLKSALTVLIVFSLLVVTVSLLAYPQLIYWTVSSAYQNNPSLLGFAKSTGQTFAFLGGIGNGLAFAMPGIRDFFTGLGAIIKPIADLDNAGKYLLFQNLAAWVSAFSAIFYVGSRGKGLRYRKGKRS